MQEYRLTLLQKTFLTKDIVQARFSKPKNFVFQSGQFIQFLIPDSSRFTPRAYSICSTPPQGELEFCIKLLPDGKASNHFLAMNEGDEIAIRGPRGQFTNGQPTSVYCIATGAGIAPVVSIIRDELENKKTDREIRLLFGVRSEEDIFWHDRFETLARTHPLFSYEITLSQPKPTGSWAGLRGRVTEHILHHLVDHNFFLCGSAAMVKDVRQILVDNGIDKTAIHFEIF